MAQFYFVQYHCHIQLCEAITYARDIGISVKGDIPIGIYRYSVDAWMYPQLFDQSQQVWKIGWAWFGLVTQLEVYELQ